MRISERKVEPDQRRAPTQREQPDQPRDRGAPTAEIFGWRTATRRAPCQPAAIPRRAARSKRRRRRPVDDGDQIEKGFVGSSGEQRADVAAERTATEACALQNSNFGGTGLRGRSPVAVILGNSSSTPAPG